MKACPEAEGGLSLFQLARLRIQGDQNFSSSFCLIKALLNLITGEWKQISVVVTSSHLLLTRWVGHSFFWCNSSPVTPTFNFRDFFTWLFQPGKDQLEVIAAIAIPTIQGLVGLPISYTNVLTESIRSLSSKSGRIGSALRLNLDIIDLNWKPRYNFVRNLDCPHIGVVSRMAFFNWWRHFDRLGKFQRMQL